MMPANKEIWKQKGKGEFDNCADDPVCNVHESEPRFGARPNLHDNFEICESSKPIGNKETESSADLVDLFHIILQIHFTC